jgi:prophage regulatory protein
MMDGDTVTPPKPERFLRIGSVLDRTGLSRTTLYRKIAEGSFPKQIRISERCTAWREADVDKWVHEALFRFVESKSS